MNKFCQSGLKMEEIEAWLTKSKHVNKAGYELAFWKLCHCDITSHKTAAPQEVIKPHFK